MTIVILPLTHKCSNLKDKIKLVFNTTSQGCRRKKIEATFLSYLQYLKKFIHEKKRPLGLSDALKIHLKSLPHLNLAGIQ